MNFFITCIISYCKTKHSVLWRWILCFIANVSHTITTNSILLFILYFSIIFIGPLINTPPFFCLALEKLEKKNYHSIFGHVEMQCQKSFWKLWGFSTFLDSLINLQAHFYLNQFHLCSFLKNAEMYFLCSVVTYFLASLGMQLPTKSLWEKTIPGIRGIWVTGGKKLESK